MYSGKFTFEVSVCAPETAISHNIRLCDAVKIKMSYAYLIKYRLHLIVNIILRVFACYKGIVTFSYINGYENKTKMKKKHFVISSYYSID